MRMEFAGSFMRSPIASRTVTSKLSEGDYCLAGVKLFTSSGAIIGKSDFCALLVFGLWNVPNSMGLGNIPRLDVGIKEKGKTLVSSWPNWA